MVCFTFSGILAYSRIRLFFRLCMIRQKHGNALQKVSQTADVITTTVAVMKQMYVVEFTCLVKETKSNLLAMACKMWHIRSYLKVGRGLTLSVKCCWMKAWYFGVRLEHELILCHHCWRAVVPAEWVELPCRITLEWTQRPSGNGN